MNSLLVHSQHPKDDCLLDRAAADGLDGDLKLERVTWPQDHHAGDRHPERIAPVSDDKLEIGVALQSVPNAENHVVALQTGVLPL